MSYEKIQRAVKRLENMISESDVPVYGSELSSLDIAVPLVKGVLHNKENEAFLVLYLTSKHCLIKQVVEFEGTIDSSAVHPRNIVKRALELNAAAVILAHNHPSGDVFPSEADKKITNVLKDILAVVDVHVLDHIIVGYKKKDYFSFAQSFLL